MGFLPVLVGVALVTDSDLTSSFRKRKNQSSFFGARAKKWTHGIERLPEGKAGRQRRGFRRHLCPRHCRFYNDHHKPRPSTPKFGATLQSSIDSSVDTSTGSFQAPFTVEFEAQCR